MARTLAGNLRGSAARRDGLHEIDLTPNEQDKRIIALKRRLMGLLSEDEWRKIYLERPLNGNLQEQYFKDQLDQVLPFDEFVPDPVTEDPDRLAEAIEIIYGEVPSPCEISDPNTKGE